MCLTTTTGYGRALNYICSLSRYSQSIRDNNTIYLKHTDHAFVDFVAFRVGLVSDCCGVYRATRHDTLRPWHTERHHRRRNPSRRRQRRYYVLFRRSFFIFPFSPPPPSHDIQTPVFHFGRQNDAAVIDTRAATRSIRQTARRRWHGRAARQPFRPPPPPPLRNPLTRRKDDH